MNILRTLGRFRRNVTTLKNVFTLGYVGKPKKIVTTTSQNIYHWQLLVLQKQPLEVFYKISCFEKFRKIHEKTPVSESLVNKVAGLKACFPVNIEKFLRKPILKNMCELLLLVLQVPCFK